MRDYSFRNVLDGPQIVRDEELVLRRFRTVRCRKAEVTYVRVDGVARVKAGTGTKFDVLPTHLKKKYAVVTIMRANGKPFRYKGIKESPLEIATQLEARGYIVNP